MRKFPGRGGGKKCAEEFGVSPQQWSPWERGMRTPDELRLSQIAKFFGVTVEYLRRDNTKRDDQLTTPDGQHLVDLYKDFSATPALQPLADHEPPAYGLPSLRRDDNLVSGNNVTELAMTSARLLGMVGSTTKGVAEGKFDIGRSIIVLRRLCDILEQRLREAENRGALPPPHPY